MHDRAVLPALAGGHTSAEDAATTTRDDDLVLGETASERFAACRKSLAINASTSNTLVRRSINNCRKRCTRCCCCCFKQRSVDAVAPSRRSSTEWTDQPVTSDVGFAIANTDATAARSAHSIDQFAFARLINDDEILV